LEYLLKNYIFNNQFILKLLSFYKNRISVSKKVLSNFIEKERKKLKIPELIYEVASKYGSNTLEILFDYDGNDSEVLFDIINNKNLLKIILEDDNREVIEKIINFSSFDLKKIDTEKLFLMMCYVFGEESTESLGYFFKTLKTNLFNFCYKDLNLDRVISVVSSVYEYGHMNNDTLNLYLKTLLDFILEEPSSSQSLKDNENKEYSTTLKSIINLAIKLDNVEIVKSALESKALKPLININSKDENNEYPIEIAFQNYFLRKEDLFYNSKINADMFQYLVENDANYSMKFGNDVYILYTSLLSKSHEFMKVILNHPKYLKQIKFDDFKEIFLPTTSISILGMNVILYNDIFSNPKLINVLENYLQESTPNKRIIILYSLLMKAIYENRLDIIKKYIKYSYLNRYKVDTRILNEIHTGYSPLAFSYILERKNIFNYLLENLTETNFKLLDGYNRSTIYFATLKEDISTLKRLLEENNIHELHSSPISMLKISAEIGNMASIRFFLDMLCENEGIGELFFDEFQFYVISSRKLKTEDKIYILKKLYDLGTNINYCAEYKLDFESSFPLKLAYENPEMEFPLVKFLLERGANIEKSFNNVESFIFDSIIQEHYTLAAYLIEHYSFNPNVIINETTPLIAAVYSAHCPLVKLLLEYGSDPDFVPITNKAKKRSLLMLAIRLEYEDIIKELIKHHAKIKFNNKSDYYRLIRSLQNDSWGLLDYIKENHIDINTPDRLKSIIMDGKLNLMKILVDSELLYMDDKDALGNTPLFYAVQFGSPLFFKYFIECGSDVNMENYEGETVDTINHRYNYTYNQSTYNIINRIMRNATKRNHHDPPECQNKKIKVQ
jgi:ankyrin repeat protein